MTFGRFFSFALLLASSVPAVQSPAQAASALPYNTIDCGDWTRNPDGTWTAHADAKPFKVGSQQMDVEESTFGPHDINVDGHDLAGLLDLKCGTNR